MSSTHAQLEPPVADPLSFSVSDANGSRTLDCQGIDGHRLVSDLASSIATQLELPTNVPYSIRNDDSANMQREDLPVSFKNYRRS